MPGQTRRDLNYLYHTHHTHTPHTSHTLHTHFTHTTHTTHPHTTHHTPHHRPPRSSSLPPPSPSHHTTPPPPPLPLSLPGSDRFVCDRLFSARGSCSASARAAAGVDAQARTADRLHGSGSCTPPQCWSEREKGGVAAARRPTGTEHRRQSQGG